MESDKTFDHPLFHWFYHGNPCFFYDALWACRIENQNRQLNDGGFISLVSPSSSSSILLKAGSYALSWPLLFALIGVNIWLRLEENSWKSYLVIVAFSIPAIFILSPIIYLVEAMMSM